MARKQLSSFAEYSVHTNSVLVLNQPAAQIALLTMMQPQRPPRQLGESRPVARLRRERAQRGFAERRLEQQREHRLPREVAYVRAGA